MAVGLVRSATAGATRGDKAHYAHPSGDPERVQAALDLGADMERVWRDGWTALMVTGVHYRGAKSEECVELLLAARADVNFMDNRGRTALFFFAHRSAPNMVKRLLEEGVEHLDPSDGHHVSALNHATRNNHAEIVEALLAARADPHKGDLHGSTASHAALRMTEPHHADIRRLHGHDGQEGAEEEL